MKEFKTAIDLFRRDVYKRQIIYNALIIIALIPLALKGVKYREVPAGKLLSRNLLIYGLGGLAAPFIDVYKRQGRGCCR